MGKDWLSIGICRDRLKDKWGLIAKVYEEDERSTLRWVSGLKRTNEDEIAKQIHKASSLREMRRLRGGDTLKKGNLQGKKKV